MSHLVKQYLGSYFITETILGQGNWPVKLCFNAVTNQKLAVKCIEKKRLTSIGSQNLKRELQIHKSISSQCSLVPALYKVEEDEQFVYLFLEFLHGDTVSYIERKGKFTEQEARIVILCVVKALQSIHLQDIAHRDVKCENILLQIDSNDKIVGAKLCDFGLACYTEKDKPITIPCGSPPYAAPEIITMKNYFGARTDVWAIGVVLYTLLEGAFPFNQPTFRSLRDQIKSARYVVPSHFSNEVKDLLSRLLEKDSQKRITLQEILKHPWMKEMEDNFEVPRSVSFIWDDPNVSEVYVSGTFCSWQHPIKLNKVTIEDISFFSEDILLYPGVYQYKFIVDGVWYCDRRKIIIDDGSGNLNNFIEVFGNDDQFDLKENRISSTGVFTMEV